MTAAAAILKMLKAAAIVLAAVLLISAAAVVGVMLWGAWFFTPFVIVLSLLGGAFFVTTAYSCFFGAPFVPTDSRNVEEMIRLAGLKPGERLADLGSGDGRILIAAAKAGAQADGWEISPFLWLWSKWKIRRAGVADRARAHLGSYWEEKFSGSDVITLFLINTQMERMQKKLRAELRPGSRVVSYAFKFPGWEIAARNDHGVYLYRQTEQKGG